MLLFSLRLILNSHFRPQKEYWETMKQFSYQKYYSLCRFNYVCLSFSYFRLLFNCLLVIQLCSFVFQLCLLVVQLLYLIMPAWHSIMFDIILQLLLLRAFLAWGLQMASKEIQDVSDSEGKGENYQRALTLLNGAVDILRVSNQRCFCGLRYKRSIDIETILTNWIATSHNSMKFIR